MTECKLCKEISIMIYLNDYLSLIIQIQSFKLFILAPVETQMLSLEERRLIEGQTNRRINARTNAMDERMDKATYRVMWG